MRRHSAPVHPSAQRQASRPVGRRVALIAAVSLALAACGSESESLPVIRIGAGSGGAVNAAADAPAESMGGDTAKMSMIAWLEYELGAELPALDGDAEGWTLSSDGVDAARLAALAEVLGVEGEVVAQPADMGGGWSVGSTDGTGDSLWASADGPGWWSYSAAWDDTASGWACPDVAVDPVPADIGAGSGGETAPAVEPPIDQPVDPAVGSDETTADGSTADVAPDVTSDAAPGRGGAPDECVEPEPPANVPTADEAEELFRAMLADLGVAAEGLTFESYADDWSASVYATREVDGMPTPLSWSASYGADAEVTYANGAFAEPVSAGMLPRVGTAAAFERLTSSDGGWWSMAPMARSAVSSSSAESPTVGAAASATERAADDSAPTVDVMPTESEPVDVQPVTVTIVGVEESLWSVWDVDSTTWLVPAYDFIDADGGRYTVPAVPDEMIETSVPETPEPITPDTEAPITAATEVPVTEPTDGTASQDTVVDPTIAPPVEIDGPEFPNGVESLIGLPEADAVAAVEAAGFEARIVARDGEYFAVTADYRVDRVNLEIVDEVITAASIG